METRKTENFLLFRKEKGTSFQFLPVGWLIDSSKRTHIRFVRAPIFRPVSLQRMLIFPSQHRPGGATSSFAFRPQAANYYRCLLHYILLLPSPPHSWLWVRRFTKIHIFISLEALLFFPSKVRCSKKNV